VASRRRRADRTGPPSPRRSDLAVGGDFTNADGDARIDLLRRTGAAFVSPGGAAAGALNHEVFALAVDRADLYVGGRFTDAGGVTPGSPGWDGARGMRWAAG
jgi:hypothetical protein